MVPFPAPGPHEKAPSPGGIWEGACSSDGDGCCRAKTSATGQNVGLECGEFGLARLQVILSIAAHAEASFRGGFTE